MDNKKDAKFVTVVNCGRLRLRKKPNVDAEVIKEIEVGKKLKVIGSYAANGFIRVSDETGVYGFVMASYTE